MGETGELEFSAGEFEVFCWYLWMSVLLLGIMLKRDLHESCRS